MVHVDGMGCVILGIEPKINEIGYGYGYGKVSRNARL